MNTTNITNAQLNSKFKISHLNTFKVQIITEFNNCKPFYLIFIPFFTISMLAPLYYGDTLFYEFEIYFRRIRSILYPIILTSITLIVISTVFRRGEQNVTDYLKTKIFTPRINQLLFTLLCACLTHFLFLGCFLYWKMKIPMANPFSWDTTFAQTDAFLLGGHQAGELFLNTVNSNFILKITDSNYLIWGIVATSFWLLIGTISRIPKTVRSHYFLAVATSWIFIGLLTAVLFSSAGPVYYGNVTGDHELYANLFKRLNDSHLDLLAMPLQNYLWDVHSGQILGVAGISAMPSMHNAQALLFVLLSLHIGRIYIFLTTIFAIFIFYGSVILGWHYLVDGLVAYALVLPIWYITGKITKNSVAKTRAFTHNAKNCQ